MQNSISMALEGDPVVNIVGASRLGNKAVTLAVPRTPLSSGLWTLLQVHPPYSALLHGVHWSGKTGKTRKVRENREFDKNFWKFLTLLEVNQGVHGDLENWKVREFGSDLEMSGKVKEFD